MIESYGIFVISVITYVLGVEESIPRSFTKLLCLGDLEKPRSTSGFAGARGY